MRKLLTTIPALNLGGSNQSNSVVGQPIGAAMSGLSARTLIDRRNRAYPIRNRILANLSPDDIEALQPHLRRVEIKAHSVLQEANRRIEFVHFIEHGLVSRISSSGDCSIETAMVGRFGCTGVAIALGSKASTQQAIVRLPGVSLRIKADELSNILQERPQIRVKMLQFVQSMITQSAQGVLCAAKHDVVQRLARWLLLAADRMQSDTLMVTHDLLAKVLGVRRAGITDALRCLENEGLLRKTRGAVRLASRAGLELRACDCYGIVRDAYSWSRNLTTSDPCCGSGQCQPRISVVDAGITA